MKKILVVSILLLSFSLLGCALEEQATNITSDVQNSIDNIKTEANKIVDTVNTTKEKIVETADDIKNAAQKIKEAKEALNEITK